MILKLFIFGDIWYGEINSITFGIVIEYHKLFVTLENIFFL